jgi:hypothetical protein
MLVASLSPHARTPNVPMSSALPRGTETRGRVSGKSPSRFLVSSSGPQGFGGSTKIDKLETPIRASRATTAPSDAGGLSTGLGIAQTARG